VGAPEAIERLQIDRHAALDRIRQPGRQMTLFPQAFARKGDRP
jgi:hypothetical protein